MEGYMNGSDLQVKFHEDWLEHKGHDGKWSRYWTVLKNNTFFFFRNDLKTPMTLAGTLTLDHKSKVECKGGDSKSGYKFELYTQKRLSYCKTKKSCERELWKAYVEGITKGKVSDKIDLLPGQIREIQDQLSRYCTVKMTSGTFVSPEATHGAMRRFSDPGSTHSFDSPSSSTSESFATTIPRDYMEPVSIKQLQRPEGTYQALPDFNSSELVFYSGLTASGRPSWYFDNCSRKQAEEILKVGAQFGNTLMRSRPGNERDLVISKMNGTLGATSFSHFIVRCHANGYKLDVDNHHEPMRSLSEVMKYFIETSGHSSTRPMSCHDLSRLGLIDSNPYSMSIITGTLDDPYFFPAPPPPLPASDMHTTAEFPQTSVTNLPLPLPPAPQLKSGGRSNSEPAIPGFRVHVEKLKEKQLKKTSEANQTKAPMIKSFSQDSEERPPLPPNHPTAGRSELNMAMQALRPTRKLSEPRISESNELQPKLPQSAQERPNSIASATLPRTEKPWGNTIRPLSSRQRDPSQEDISVMQVSAPEVSSTPRTESNSKRISLHQSESGSALNELAAITAKVTKQPSAPEVSSTPRTESNSKRISLHQSESGSALNELAAITAKVTKQPLLVKEGPEVATKPLSGGVVSKAIAMAAFETKPQSSQLKAPLQSTAKQNFKKKLGSPTAPSTSLAGNAVLASQGNSSGLYENMQQYQNAKEILASPRNKYD